MISKILAKILGTANDRQLKRMRPTVDRINAFEPAMQALSDEQLAHKTNEFREQLSQGKHLNDIMPEAFAVVREASRRTLGQRHFDVQLMGGIALFEGKIAEMKTGEGKTLTATLPLYTHALLGKGAHLVTVNDYLAKRDAEWMAPIYNKLGLTVAYLQNSMEDAERKKVYQADILYATNNELGFDYLRDNMKFRLEDYVQRDLYYAMVDEVDSILIDEARTPLIISGAADRSSKLYQDADQAMARLKREADYEVDEKARSVYLTESGNDKLEEAFGVENLYAVEHTTLLHHAMQALKAHVLFRRDVEYVVKDGQVLIVDEFTGRILPGRRYSDGLHQALEAKENVKIERESQTLATITLQNYFRLYTKLAGMTGTAMTEAEEFYKIYKLSVLSIPTNRPMIRIDQEDLVFLTKNAKYRAIIEDIQERHIKGQPILIGTIAIETSELLSMILRSHNIPHEVLNAKQHQREAEIVAHAGEPGRVTIATNMAGRGTDIKLSQESLQAGGLYVLGTERHESRRIDNQLRGRSGRQGDPGESRFYISLEDDLMRIFGGGDSMKKKMQFVGMREDEVLEGGWISSAIAASQEKVERQNFDVRKHLLEYDDVLNQQRIVVYGYRRDVLEGAEHSFDLIRDMIAKAIEDAVAYIFDAREVNAEGIKHLRELLHNLTRLPITDFEFIGTSSKTIDTITRDCINFLLEQYSLLRNARQSAPMAEAEKWLMLETIDKAWKLHMLNLDYLREGISLRSWGQKVPLIEYKREAFAMFKDMMAGIYRDVVHHIFHINVEHFNHLELERKREKELDELRLISSDTSSDSSRPQEQALRSGEKVGRNEQCPCGSGKKYKKCCGA